MHHERPPASGRWHSLVVLSVLAACGGSDSPSAGNLALDCRAQATATVGAYTVTSGDGSSNDDWAQCVALASEEPAGVKMRWTWQGGSSPDGWPRGSLSLFAGSDGLESSMPELPARVNGASRALVTYDLASSSSGHSTLSLDWAVIEMLGNNWGWQSPQHAVNVILDDSSGLPSYGEFVERATIDGVAFDVYHDGPNDHGSTWTGFRPVTSLLGKGHVDILALSQYMKTRAWITGEEKLAYLILENQAWDGEGETVANSWRLQVD